MAGVKGRSGGARPGAGRKPKAPAKVQGEDMLELLKQIALGKVDASPTQVRAAVAAVQYTHAKVGEGGKKEGRQKAAEAVSGGRFQPSAPPKLVAVK